VGRIQVALTPGHSPDSSGEIAALLRNNLGVGVLVAFGVSFFFFALRFLRYPLDTRTVWLVYVPAAVFLAVNSVVAILVRRLDAGSLRRLRVYEIVFIGIWVTYFAWDHYSTYFVTNAWFPQFVQRPASDISLLVRHPSYSWLAIIVAYGTF